MNPIEINSEKILKYMVENKIKPASGDMIKNWFDLTSEEVNDAVYYLNKKLRAVEVLNASGTAPYNFANVGVNTNGRYIYYQLEGGKNPIEVNAKKILNHMVDNKINRAGGNMIKNWFDLTSEEVNDAVYYLEKGLRAVEVLNASGTAPYNFANIGVNSRGRQLYYEFK